MSTSVVDPPPGTSVPTGPPPHQSSHQSSHQSGHHPRRGDIQGLRAIAVLIVIGAHAGLSPLTGGFVGVDVFFVISGFLITRLLFLEASRTGTISLRGFYARRARRILPAATVVSIVTMIGSLIWLSARDALEVVYDVAWATFFGANIRFGQREVDYFAQDQGPSPMQHYWSLSVEEQFYLFWPLVLLAVLVWTRRRHGHGRLPRVPLLTALTVLTLGSFLYATILTNTTPAAAYFSTPARVWELGVGATLALVASPLAVLMGAQLRSLLAATGLAMIAISCLEFGEATAFPGSAALLPVIGSALILLAGSHPEGATAWVSRGLSLPPLRTIGDWSYSLYLWHWPVLILAVQGLGRELKPAETALALVAIFGLSAATYWWIETPFRQPRSQAQWRSLIMYPVVVAMVTAACGGAGAYATWLGAERGNNPAITLSDYPATTDTSSASPGADPADNSTLTPGDKATTTPAAEADPAIALVEASAIATREGRPIPSDLTPDLLDLEQSYPDVGACNYVKQMSALCPRGAVDADKTMVLIGDSHARSWIPAFDEIGAEGNWQTYYLVHSGCTASRVSVSNREGELDTHCDAFREWSLKQIRRLKPDLVVVATAPANNGVYVDGKRVTDVKGIATAMTQGYDELFDLVTPLTERTVLIRDVPRADSDIPECLAKRRNNLGDCAVTPSTFSTQLADLSVKAAARAKVEVIDSTRWFCADGICPPVIGSTIPMRDSQHLSVEYSRQLAESLGTALGLWPTG